MAKKCPLGGVSLYLDCLECEDKLCKKANRMKERKVACIGIDQSYKNTGISISINGKLKMITSIDLTKLNTKSEKRKLVASKIQKAIDLCKKKNADEINLIFERVRLRSQGFLSMDYIQSMSGLNTTIIDTCFENGIKAYSVDTRCWKAQVVGTSKPENNKYGVASEKWPTVKWLIGKGFEDKILLEVEGRRQKGTFTRNGVKYEYNNDAADSAAISMFWFVGDHQKLKEEH